MAKRFALDSFCIRQWDATYVGSKFHGTGITQEFVEQACNASSAELVDGYAPFCKHIFLPNTWSDKLQAADVEITKENDHLIRSGYESRTPKELPVLARWINLSDLPESPKPAKWLDVILYSRDQIRKEQAATGSPVTEDLAPWRIISVKAQNDGFELPMSPITMMRNALGKEEGGSGVKLERAEYDKAVKYWSTHVFVRL